MSCICHVYICQACVMLGNMTYTIYVRYIYIHIHILYIYYIYIIYVYIATLK